MSLEDPLKKYMNGFEEKDESGNGVLQVWPKQISRDAVLKFVSIMGKQWRALRKGDGQERIMHQSVNRGQVCGYRI